jgi:hypothetical protein
VNIKIAGKWMFIPLKMVLIGIDPYPNLCNRKKTQLSAFLVHVSVIAKLRLHRILMKTPKRWQVVWPGYFSCWTSSSPDMWPVTHVTSAYRMNTIYIYIYIYVYIYSIYIYIISLHTIPIRSPSSQFLPRLISHSLPPYQILSTILDSSTEQP